MTVRYDEHQVLPSARAILGRTLDACQSLRLPNGLIAHVIVEPGQVLNQSAQDRVYDLLVPVTSSSFGADMTPYWAQRSKEGYLDRLAEFVVVCDVGGMMVGWTGYHLLSYDGFAIRYLDSTGIVPRFQSGGTMRELMQRWIMPPENGKAAPASPAYLTARSESPIFYKLMRKLLPGHLYPNPSSPTPPQVVAVARHLARWLGQADLLDEAALTIRGAYDALDQLYGELPTCGDRELDQMFGSQLGPLDAFLLVGQTH